MPAARRPALARAPRAVVAPASALLAALLAAGGAADALAQSPEDAPSLVAGLRPVRVQGVARAANLNDGRAGYEGDAWNTRATTRLADASAFADYDLGARRSIAAAWLQGDNNDQYEIAVSDDGENFVSLWRAPPVEAAGLRERFADDLKGAGRFLRIRAAAGDGAFSLSEVQVFERRPAVFPPRLRAVRGMPLDKHARNRIVMFGLALASCVLLAGRGRPRWWNAATLAWPAVAGVQLAQAVIENFPLAQREVSLVRGTLALVAAVAILREALAPARFPAHRGAVLGTLGLAGVLSFLAFYNLGQPQFWDGKRGRWTFVHYLDLRQYYPTAKYFGELGYRGLYEADVAALVEDDPSSTLDGMGEFPMRDLGDLQMSTVGEQRERIEAIKGRFRPERWQAYKRDAAYFRNVMGTPHYLDTMHDMGGNATPVWIGLAHILFNLVDPGERGFFIGALFDPVLLGLAFLMIGRAFGPRTALVSLVVFGANDFIMYGTNWAGATLRHDWLAYLALGACALKRERWVLGGALLGMSTMIRAFPIVAIAGATLPSLWLLWQRRREGGRFPALAEIRALARPAERLLLGAALTVAVLFLFSALVVPVRAWGDWLHKIGQLSADPHPSHLSLRSLIAGWEPDQWSIIRARLPLFVGATLLFVGAVVLAARGRPPAHAAVLALPLIPVVFYPANYYIHFVFILPLLADERAAGPDQSAREPDSARRFLLAPRDAGIWLTLLFMCWAQYFTVLEDRREIHFYMSSVILFTALGSILVLLVRPRVAAWFAPSGTQQPLAAPAALAPPLDPPAAPPSAVAAPQQPAAAPPLDPPAA